MTALTYAREELEFLIHSNFIEGEPIKGVAVDDAWNAWVRVRDLPKLTEADILDCHRLLMATRKLRPELVGAWTTVQTSVGGRENPEPWKVPALMAAWVEAINADTKHQGRDDEEEAKAFAKHFHVKFEHIHPFADGNGRVGRILYNWHRLRLGLPIHVIEYGDRHEYYDWF